MDVLPCDGSTSTVGQNGEKPPNIKKPRCAGLFQCAREDSNLHGPYSPQGPQPCASTNSATGAGGGQYSLGPRFAGDLRSSAVLDPWRVALGRGVRHGDATPVLDHALAPARAARAVESVLGPRYSAEHMFDCVRLAEPNEQGAD